MLPYFWTTLYMQLTRQWFHYAERYECEMYVSLYKQDRRLYFSQLQLQELL
jgi:hypothetical protein